MNRADDDEYDDEGSPGAKPRQGDAVPNIFGSVGDFTTTIERGVLSVVTNNYENYNYCLISKC